MVVEIRDADNVVTVAVKVRLLVNACLMTNYQPPQRCYLPRIGDLAKLRTFERIVIDAFRKQVLHQSLLDSLELLDQSLTPIDHFVYLLNDSRDSLLLIE